MIKYRKNLRIGFELRKKNKVYKGRKFYKENKEDTEKDKSRRLNTIAIKYQELKVLDRKVADKEVKYLTSIVDNTYLRSTLYKISRRKYLT